MNEEEKVVKGSPPTEQGKNAAKAAKKEGDEFTFYLTQSDVAKKFNTTPRMLLYWESLGLIHPTLSKDPGAKVKRYTFEDLKEIEFVKSLLDEGYSTTSLKEKLSQLQSPYRYEKDSLLWDMRDKKWKTRGELGVEYLKENLMKVAAHEDAPEKIINFVFDALDKE